MEASVIMNQELINRLCKISPEEQAILNGNPAIDRNLYMEQNSNTIHFSKLLEEGKMITIRPNTRFVHFPEHLHDYVEVVYMCTGKTRHLVNGREIILRPGELLFLGQSVTHEVFRAEEQDVAVNFIVLPDFFTEVLPAMGEEETPLRRFLIGCLCGETSGMGYLYFQVSQMPIVQNLVENLLWMMITDTPNKRKSLQMTMALLFMTLTGHAETLSAESREESILLSVLHYVEIHYRDGSLQEIARELHYNIPWLSRLIKHQTGKTYTQMVQEKRLAQAAFLLKNTRKNVSDISEVVGYENISYFHRAFSRKYGMSPKHYRDQI